MKNEDSYVYILANKKHGTLYVWVTSNLIKRIYEHKEKVVDWFTKEYDIWSLVYFEAHSSIEEAIKKEKLLKKWKRDWKIKLIEDNNPDWRDLYEDLI